VVAALAAALRAQGRSPVVVSRGYRREGRGTVVASRGSGLLVPWQQVGDEPALLAELLDGVGVVVDSDRRRGARLAIDDLGADCIVLDDGFSHLALARDLDLVLLPAGDPLGGGLLAPGGRLREPLRALARADAVLVVGSPAGGAASRDIGVVDGLGDALREAGYRGPLWQVAVEAELPRLVEGGASTSAVFLAVAAIARPERFFTAARAAGLDVRETLTLRDHDPYSPATLAQITTLATRCGADAVVTTAKDRVKLGGRLVLPLWELPIAAQLPPELLDRVAEVVAGAPGRELHGDRTRAHGRVPG
jgi:tetraacyldisaccharide 4'-kinase